jgi:sugar lactone lactonase YvrE
MKTLQRYTLLPIVLSCFLLITSCKKDNESEIAVPTEELPIEQLQKKWIVSTIAGTGNAGYANGPAASATFNTPYSIAIDSSGNLFVSDQSNAIRKISNGLVSTYAGKGPNDSTFIFSGIMDMVINKNGDILGSELSQLREIRSSGAISVFAGSLEENYIDGVGENARFSVIRTITSDTDGNVYIPDYDRNANFLIRKVTPARVVSTITLIDSTGYSSGSQSNHFYTAAIAIDPDGNIFYGSNGNSIIKKADRNGNVTIFAGAGDIGLVDGKGRDAKFNMISALATDRAGNLYVADMGNHAIRKITPDATVTTLAGIAGRGNKDGSGNEAMLHYPSDIVIDQNGIIYITDSGNSTVRKLEYK